MPALVSIEKTSDLEVVFEMNPKVKALLDLMQSMGTTVKN